MKPAHDCEDWKREPDPWEVISGAVMNVLAVIASFCALAIAAGFFLR
jgi:hypothetical protein